MLDESPTLANLGNYHEFIIKEYCLHWYEAFWETQNKATRAYAQSGQYHTIVESRVQLTLITTNFVLFTFLLLNQAQKLFILLFCFNS